MSKPKAITARPRPQVTRQVARREVFQKPGMLAMSPAAWGHEYEIMLSSAPCEAPPPFELHGGTAVVDIKGPLVHHVHPYWDSYEAIGARLDAAFDCQETSAVVMRINSPGGDVDGGFEFARSIRDMRVKHKKPLYAFADGMAASAAYAIASAADEIVVPISGFVGSIGIIEALVDQSAADAAQGIRYMMLTSGARKSDGNPHVPITKDAAANLQGQVDGLAELFFELVEDLRGLSKSKLRGLEAAMFFGERAISAGLADRVSNFEDLIAYAASGGAQGTRAMPKFLDMLEKHMAEAEDEGESRHMKEAYKAYLKSKAKGLEEDGGEKGDEGAPPEKKEAKAEGEDEAKKAKASASKSEDEDEEKKMKAEDEAKKAKATAAVAAAKAAVTPAENFDLAREFQAFKAEVAAKDARAALFATRPDFDAKLIATMSAWPVELVEQACTTFPRIAAPKPAAAQAIAGVTRGATQLTTETVSLAKSDVDFIDAKMGLANPHTGIQMVGNSKRELELGVMTHAQAAAHVAKLNEAAKKEVR